LKTKVLSFKFLSTIAHLCKFYQRDASSMIINVQYLRKWEKGKSAVGEIVRKQSCRDATSCRATLIMQIFGKASRAFEKARRKLLSAAVRQVRTSYCFGRLFSRRGSRLLVRTPAARNILSRLKSRAEYCAASQPTNAKLFIACTYIAVLSARIMHLPINCLAC